MSTASIVLRTGLPGSGKSLRTIQRILEELEKGTTVYTCNINDLSIKGVIDFPDPTKWTELPANSILFVDECQRFFPSRRAGEVPPHIRAMETIRHMGVRLELITQRPTYIDSHIRGLVGEHEHLLRRNGKESSHLYRWDEVQDEPKSDTARRQADTSDYVFKPSLYQHYKSAELHTMKRRINWRTKKGIAVFALAGCILAYVAYYVATSIFGVGREDAAAMDGAALAATPTTGTATDAFTAMPSAGNDVDPVAMFTPRVPGLPWTAPAYDHFEVLDYPRAHCIISGDQRIERITCNCYTQQATVIDMDDATCIAIARGGYWDPRRAPVEDRIRQNAEEARQRIDDERDARTSSFAGSSPLRSATGVGATFDRAIREPHRLPEGIPSPALDRGM